MLSNFSEMNFRTGGCICIRVVYSSNPGYLVAARKEKKERGKENAHQTDVKYS